MDIDSNLYFILRVFGVIEEDENNREIDEIVDEPIIQTQDIFEILNTVERSNFRLPKHIRCAAHTLNLLATTDTQNFQKQNQTFKAISHRVFSKCQLLFNKQNQSSLSGDKIKNILGRYLITPNDTRYSLINNYY